MKKTFILIAMLVAISNVWGQNDSLCNRRGIPFLPKPNDWAVGTDAASYISFFGNLFNTDGENGLEEGARNLYFRYYITKKSAIRLNILINTDVDNNKYFVADDVALAASALSNQKVEDKMSSRQSELAFLVGLQKSRGYGRLKGFYGLQIGYGYKKYATKYAYGNAITATNTEPTDQWGNTGGRPLKIDHGSEKTFRVGGFVGVEYYFVPKICLGGECSLMYAKTWESLGYTDGERWQGGQVIETYAVNTPGDDGFNFETFRPATYGGLYLLFHF